LLEVLLLASLELVKAIVVPDAHMVLLVRGAAHQVHLAVGPVRVARLAQTVDLLVLLGLGLEPVERVVVLRCHVALGARVDRDALLQDFLRPDQVRGAHRGIRWVLTLAEGHGRLGRRHLHVVGLQYQGLLRRNLDSAFGVYLLCAIAAYHRLLGEAILKLLVQDIAVDGLSIVPGAVLRALRPVYQRHVDLEDLLRCLRLGLRREGSRAGLAEPVRGLGHEEALFPKLVLCGRRWALQR